MTAQGKVMNVYLKIFLIGGLGYGLAMGVLFAFMFSVKAGIILGLGTGLLYGVVMSLILGTMQVLAVRKLGTDTSEKLLGIHQVNVITVKSSSEDAFDACLQVLSALFKCKIHQDRDAGVIRAETATTWKSFGEIVLLTVSAESDTCSRITISSKPVVRTTVLDYGKNVQNIRLIVHALTSRMELLTTHEPVPVSKQGPIQTSTDSSS